MHFPKLLVIFAAAVAAPAQQPPASTSSLVAQQGGLKILVVEGEGAKNNIRTRTATAPVVEVRDEGDKPVAGAEVIFQLPPAGPGGVFNQWLRLQTVRTDSSGRAAASGFTPNDEEGRFNIKVTVTAGTRAAGAVIAQSNVRGSNGSRAGAGRTSGWWKVVAVVGAGAVAGGVYAGTRSGDAKAATPTTNPITITIGAISVGGPR